MEQVALDMFAGSDVHGSTLGILGMGRIGQGIAGAARTASACDVIYHNRSRLTPDRSKPSCKASYVGKEELLNRRPPGAGAAVFGASHHAIGAAELAQMKPTATLVNIARGGIVDDAALARRCATSASPPPASTSSRASPRCTPTC
jgi:gluconate 2-dehydrogenase